MDVQSLAVTESQAGKTVAAVLRSMSPSQSWNQVRALIAGRRITINGDLCHDPARRVKVGETVGILAQAKALKPGDRNIVIRYLDSQIVVVEKPAGMATVRHPSERYWNARRKSLEPTLEDCVPRLIAAREPPRKGPTPRLRVVHRLDKETSGLVVFARTVPAERALGKQFRAHTVIRRYLAIVSGSLASQRIASRLVRNRGDGRRGSTPLAGVGKEAVTHLEVVEGLRGYCLVSARLETGRTHQIRIHLAELGHPVLGDKVYRLPSVGQAPPETVTAPRLALHATELGFINPATGELLHWKMPMPKDLEDLLNRLRSSLSFDNRHGNQMD